MKKLAIVLTLAVCLPLMADGYVTVEEIPPPEPPMVFEVIDLEQTMTLDDSAAPDKLRACQMLSSCMGKPPWRYECNLYGGIPNWRCICVPKEQC